MWLSFYCSIYIYVCLFQLGSANYLYKCGSHFTEICLFQPVSGNYLYKCGSHSGVLTTCKSVALILLLRARYKSSSSGALTTCTSVALILLLRAVSELFYCSEQVHESGSVNCLTISSKMWLYKSRSAILLL